MSLTPCVGSRVLARVESRRIAAREDLAPAAIFRRCGHSRVLHFFAVGPARSGSMSKIVEVRLVRVRRLTFDRARRRSCSLTPPLLGTSSPFDSLLRIKDRSI